MVLDEIISNKRGEIAERKKRVPLAELERRAQAASAPRDFTTALEGNSVAVIAEIKRACPSRGSTNADLNIGQVAQTYAARGASAISVSADDIPVVRAATDLPILYKDFIVDEYQIYESRALQADAILLILRALDQTQLIDYLTLAASLGMHALVQVHSEQELNWALPTPARLVEINNRDLCDLSVDLARTERLAPLVPPDRVVIAESAIFTAGDVERAACAGADAVLVCEALMRAADSGGKVQELAGVRRGKQNGMR